MRFFITDETNIKKDDKFEFFVYGGLVISELEVKALSRKLLALKRRFNIRKERPIKWNNINWKREGILDPEIHKNIKNEILNLVNQSNAKIIISLSPHDFYHTKTFIGIRINTIFNHENYLRTLKFGVNTCLHRFNKYIESMHEKGIILADTFDHRYCPDMKDHCFSLYPDGSGEFPLSNIIYPVIQMENEYSQIHQINDIVLGAITYSMREMAENFFPIIKDNFWKGSDNYLSIFGHGINIYPKSIATAHIQEKKEKLVQKFKRLMNI